LEIFFHENINATEDREQILEIFINQLDDEELQNGYFQHDGATAHTTPDNLLYLQQFYGNRIISNRLNLTPLDFCIFGHLKDEVFKRRMHTLEELTEEITNCCNTIDQQMLQNIVNNKKKRIRK
jgi:hypothetical protein